jgi:anti-sigma B factor antagonist
MEMADMVITEQPHGRVVLLTASGRLDGSTSAAFTARIEPLISGNEPRLVLDFAGVDFISSAGLRAVLSLFKQTKAARGAFALCAVQPPVLEVLDISGFTNLIPIHAERTAALAAVNLD